MKPTKLKPKVIKVEEVNEPPTPAPSSPNPPVKRSFRTLPNVPPSKSSTSLKLEEPVKSEDLPKSASSSSLSSSGSDKKDETDTPPQEETSSSTLSSQDSQSAESLEKSQNAGEKPEARSWKPYVATAAKPSGERPSSSRIFNREKPINKPILPDEVFTPSPPIRRSASTDSIYQIVLEKKNKTAEEPRTPPIDLTESIRAKQSQVKEKLVAKKVGYLRLNGKLGKSELIYFELDSLRCFFSYYSILTLF